MIGFDRVFSIVFPTFTNLSNSNGFSALASFILQLFLLVTVLGGLTILRDDSKDLVLGPLRSMLKIVARYAKNPLSQATSTSRDNISVVSDLESEFSSHMDDDENSQDDGFGTYETEQLITAVAKITDLLRKCWGEYILFVLFSFLLVQGRSKYRGTLQVLPGRILSLQTWRLERALWRKSSTLPCLVNPYMPCLLLQRLMDSIMP
jgi:hypothetical protein